MKPLDVAIMADLIAAGITPEQLPAVFAAFDRRRIPDANARHRRKPDRAELARRKPRTTFSADAIPEPARTSEALRLGLPAELIAETFGHFGDYHAGKGTVAADWLATWRTWLRNSRRMDRLNPDRRMSRRDREDEIARSGIRQAAERDRAAARANAGDND